MKRKIKWITAMYLCLSLLLSGVLPAYAFSGNQGTTQVSLQQLVSIQEKTADLVLKVGENTTLEVIAVGSKLTYEWQLSKDGGKTYGGSIGSNSTYHITDAKENTPVMQPYFYRVTVSDSFKQTATAIIQVLVHNDYDYRTVTEGNVSVTSYMHKNTRLVVIPQDSTSTAYTELARYVDSENGMAPFECNDVSLLNSDNTVLPYFGILKLEFNVASSLNGQDLRVFHKSNSSVETLSGTVINEKLSVYTNELSPFLIEVPASSLHTITATAGTNGSIAPSGTLYLAEGENQTFVFSPNTGFVIDTVTVDSTPVTVSGNSYTFKNIMASHTIAVSFKSGGGGGGGGDSSFTITPRSGKNGRISPDQPVTVNQGDSKTFYFYPDKGYEVEKVLVDGIEVVVLGNSYTFTSVQKSSTIAVSFQKQDVPPPITTRIVTATAGVGGKISPSGDITVTYGGDLYLYFTPDKGYKIAAVTVDGTLVANSTFYHLINITENRTVHVDFEAVNDSSGDPSTPPPITPDPPMKPMPEPPAKPDVPLIPEQGGNNTQPEERPEHTITVEPPKDGGTVSPDGTLTVPKGGSQTIYFYPEDGYEIDKIFVNGEAVDASSGSYTVENIDGDVTISVVFRPINNEKTNEISCECMICSFLYANQPGDNCICPWCWIIPLLLFTAIAVLILWRYRKNKE